MKPLNRFTENALELRKILQIIGKHCRSELGIKILHGVLPAQDRKQLDLRQALLRNVLRYREIEGDFPWDSRIVPVTALLEEAKSSALMSGEDLVHVRNLLALATEVKNEIRRVQERFTELEQIGRRIRDFSAELALLDVLDEEGSLYDHATPQLREIRNRIESLKATTRKTGQALLNDPATSNLLQDRVLSFRNGRFVVLVRAENISSYPGIAIDRSGSGNSFYVEPYRLAALNNRLSAAVEEERQEVFRILRRMTLKILERETAIAEAESALGSLDLVCAEAEMVEKGGWHLPEISLSPGFRFHGLVHPLLGEKAVPIDIACGDDFRVLVVTGPNTGGKTVALKTVGVAVILSWMGLPISASEGSVVGEIDSVHVDVGDEQSIEQNLSTFSAHVKNIVSILAETGPGSLVLLDELGSGTDPQEGAALGIALLEAFREKGALVLATTHHNSIKTYALTTPGVETASMEFDAVSLKPTFALLMGIPGKSNALLIAERLGMPPAVIERARANLRGEDVSAEELIGQLQEKRAALEIEARNLAEERARLIAARQSLESRISRFEVAKEDRLKEADREAGKIVREAQEAARELLRSLERSKTVPAAHRAINAKGRDLEKIRKEAEIREEKRIEKRSVKAEGIRLQPGDTVQMVDSSIKGIVESVSGEKVTLVAGSFRMEVPMNRLKKAGEALSKTKPEISVKTIRPVGIPGSIMIRGMTVDEALPEVERYLDQAYRAGYDQVAVIHGRGTGTLRKAVTELLKTLSYVKEYRLGEHGEGGYGVTIVTFSR